MVQADLIRLIPSMIHHMDEPANPFGAGVYLVSGVARGVVKVALTGDGGDESFAGYDRFAGQRCSIITASCRNGSAAPSCRSWSSARPTRSRKERRAESPLAQRAFSLWSGGALCAQHEFLRFTQETKQKLFTPEREEEE